MSLSWTKLKLKRQTQPIELNGQFVKIEFTKSPIHGTWPLDTLDDGLLTGRERR